MDKDGALSLEEFRPFMNSKHIFVILDRDDSGYVEKDELLYAITVLRNTNISGSDTNVGSGNKETGGMGGR